MSNNQSWLDRKSLLFYPLLGSTSLLSWKTHYRGPVLCSGLALLIYNISKIIDAPNRSKRLTCTRDNLILRKRSDSIDRTFLLDNSIANTTVTEKPKPSLDTRSLNYELRKEEIVPLVSDDDPNYIPEDQLPYPFDTKDTYLNSLSILLTFSSRKRNICYVLDNEGSHIIKCKSNRLLHILTFKLQHYIN